MWPCQFSVGQTAQSLTCSIVEKPHTRLDDCLRILLSYFRKRMSASRVEGHSKKRGGARSLVKRDGIKDTHVEVNQGEDEVDFKQVS